MKAFFRADSSTTIGTGHIFRCRALAGSLRENGAEVSFVCRALAGNISDQLSSEGFSVITLPPLTPKGENSCHQSSRIDFSPCLDAAQTIEAFNKCTPDWLIVDHYGIDRRWEALLRPKVRRIMVIDDLANRLHDCDLLLDQNYVPNNHLRYKELIPQASVLLVGPHYALLRPEYANRRAHVDHRTGAIKKVLVFFGGSDEGNATGTVLEALSSPELLHLEISIVLGSNYRHQEALQSQANARGNTYIYNGLSHLADLMLDVDLAVGGGGSTTWERACLKLPSVVSVLANNQKVFTEALSHDGYQVLASNGSSPEVNEWKQAISMLVDSPAKSTAIGKKAGSLVDGFGAKRVAGTLCNFTTTPISLKISVLSDSDSWLASTITEMLEAWTSDGHCVQRVSDPQDISDGDLCFILGCSQLVGAETLQKNRHNLVVHESKLPKGKGWSPMTWQILEGRSRICVTLFEAVAGVDAGPIYAQTWIELDGTELVKDWRAKQSYATRLLCLNWVANFPKSAEQPQSQKGVSSYYARRTVADSQLDPDKTIREQFDLLRVVDNDRYPAFFILRGRRYRLKIEPMD